MGDKFSRMMEILNRLDNNSQCTPDSLASDFGVDVRTVYRYIKTLRDAGFPIDYDKKSHSYRFPQGYSLKKGDLSPEENLALALAKSVLKGMGADVAQIITGVEQRLLKKPSKLPRHIILKDLGMTQKVQRYFLELDRAINWRKQVWIKYKKREDDLSERTVDPYLIFFDPQERFWYLRAYCHLRKGMRTFAIDRIEELEVLDEVFIPQYFNLSEEIKSTFQAFVDAKPVNVELIFDREVSHQITRKKWHSSQKEKLMRDGRLKVTFRVNGIREIKHWVYSWLPFVEVKKPKKLRDLLVRELQNSLKKHQ
ncbi:MAG: transcriptional regulator [Nitrospirae bacterium]|nr:MAG: transcriptional regulator [Nitrospirota bacterium]